MRTSTLRLLKNIFSIFLKANLTKSLNDLDKNSKNLNESLQNVQKECASVGDKLKNIQEANSNLQTQLVC